MRTFVGRRNHVVAVLLLGIVVMCAWLQHSTAIEHSHQLRSNLLSRHQLQVQGKEAYDADVMKLAFGIAGKTWVEFEALTEQEKQAKQENKFVPLKGRGHNIAAVLGIFVPSVGKTVPFMWGVNTIGPVLKGGTNDVNDHAERAVMAHFYDFMVNKLKLSPETIKNIWHFNVVIYSTLQPCQSCSVELATSFGAAPRALYYGAVDKGGEAKCGTVYSGACETSGGKCSLSVPTSVAEDYHKSHATRMNKFPTTRLLYTDMSEDQTIEGNAAFKPVIASREDITKSTSFKWSFTKDNGAVFVQAGSTSALKDLLAYVPQDAKTPGNFFDEGAAPKEVTDLFTEMEKDLKEWNDNLETTKQSVVEELIASHKKKLLLDILKDLEESHSETIKEFEKELNTKLENLKDTIDKKLDKAQKKIDRDHQTELVKINRDFDKQMSDAEEKWDKQISDKEQEKKTELEKLQADLTTWQTTNEPKWAITKWYYSNYETDLKAEVDKTNKAKKDIEGKFAPELKKLRDEKRKALTNLDKQRKAAVNTAVELLEKNLAAEKLEHAKDFNSGKMSTTAIIGNSKKRAEKSHQEKVELATTKNERLKYTPEKQLVEKTLAEKRETFFKQKSDNREKVKKEEGEF